MSLKNKYKVFNVPWFWKPIYWLYGYSLGFLLYLVVWLQHVTCKVTFHGKENLTSQQNYIYCLWHQDLTGFFSSEFDFSNYSILNHPAWYMKPVHVCLRLMGIKKIFYGSSGNAGKAAAMQLTESLRNGRDTFITPDGPAGPMHDFKKGVLHLSMNSAVCIVPVRQEYTRVRTFNGWDKKKFPKLFSHINVYYGKPIIIEQSNFEMAMADIRQSMGE
jgi:lysophospholipid acyltransferase (LPLAT)-like uncharacterized protein